MKLLYVGNTGSVHFRAWPLHFRRLGHDVHVYHLHPYEPEFLEGVEWHSGARAIRARPRRTRRFLWRFSAAELLAVTRSIRPDVVHSHQIVPVSYLASVAGLRPHVATAWGSEVLQPSTRSLQRRIRRVARSADLMTADSEHVLFRLEEYGASRSRLRFVPWGVDEEWINQAARLSSTEAAARVGLPTDVQILFSPRGTLPVYRPMDVVEAISRTLSNHPEAVGLIKTDPAPTAIPLADLKPIAATYGVEERVIFHPGWAHAEMPFVYGSAAAVVSVAESDSTPTSIFEALALGVPCVVSDLPWVHESAHRALRLEVVPVGAVDLLSDVLVSTLDHPDGAAAEANRQLVVTKFGRSEIFSAMEGEYEHLASAH